MDPKIDTTLKNIELKVDFLTKRIDTINQKLVNLTPTNHTIYDETPYLWITIFTIGICLLSIGLYYYRIIWIDLRQTLNKQSFWGSLDYLIAYIPSKDPNPKQEGKINGPKRHIIAGVCTSVGLSIMIGYSLGFFSSHDAYDNHGIALGVSSMTFSILLAITAFWTLYQTKKIDHHQEHRIDSFPQLIQEITLEIEKLNEDIKNHNSTRQYHRIYFITEHPFLGLMSFPDLGISLSSALEKILNQKVSNPNIQFEMLCGNSQCIEQFIRKRRIEGRSDTDFESDVKQFKNTFELKIQPFVNSGVAIRKGEIPEYPQFIIIRNVIFEFILRPNDPATEIVAADVIRDQKRCESYIKTFNLLKEKLN